MTTPRWEYDQITKPDISGQGFLYIFDGFPQNGTQKYHSRSPDDDLPWNHFQRGTSQGTTPIDIQLLTTRYEIMAYAAEARSRALGRTPSVQAFTRNVDLQTIWPVDPQDQPPLQYSRHKWHSAQFRSTNMRQKDYWRSLLSTQGFGIQ